MDARRTRNLIPPLYGVLILAAFLISATAGVIVLIVGGAVSGLLWSRLGAGGPTRPVDEGGPAERAAARAERRAGRD